jgi:hypothetical protein
MNGSAPVATPVPNELPRLEELEELVADALPAQPEPSRAALYTPADTNGSAAAAAPLPTSARERAEPHLSVWTSHWFLEAPSVKEDTGEHEGEGAVHEEMVSGWAVDLRHEWAEPPQFKPRRFIVEWLLNLTQPLPQLAMAGFWACTGGGRRWRTFDGFTATKEDVAERGVVERGDSSGFFFFKISLLFFFVRLVPPALGTLWFDELREGDLLPMVLAYAVLHILGLNQPAAKVAIQPRAANRRLQSAFERRKNELLTGWIIAALDVAIFEIRLAAARTCLDLESRMVFECSVTELRHFLAPVLHAVDQPDEYGRRPKEEMVQELLSSSRAPGYHEQPLDSDALARLDAGNLVQPVAATEIGDGHQRCSAPVKMVMLRLLWHAVQRDGSYRNQFGNGVHSNSIGGPVGALAQFSMLLTVTVAPHIVRSMQGAEPMTTPQLVFCIVTAFGFAFGAPLVSQFCTAPVFDLARRRHVLAACRALIAGSGVVAGPPLPPQPPETRTRFEAASPTSQYAAVPAYIHARGSSRRYNRSLAVDGINLNSSGTFTIQPR